MPPVQHTGKVRSTASDNRVAVECMSSRSFMSTNFKLKQIGRTEKAAILVALISYAVP